MDSLAKVMIKTKFICGFLYLEVLPYENKYNNLKTYELFAY